MSKSARYSAYTVLLEIEKNDAYSSIALNLVLNSADLNSQDRAFATSIVYGVCERKLSLDYNLSLYLKSPLKKLKKNILTILRVGAYQIFFMDSVPASAAVNESVKLSKLLKLGYASSLINAVLRRCAESGIIYPETGDFVYDTSIKYSCSGEIVSLLTDQYGADDTCRILEYSLKPVPVFARVNTLKTTSEELIQTLAEEGVDSDLTDVKDSLALHLSAARINELKAYKDGLFHVQDLSSQQCALSVSANRGDIVYDLCSAPGGKAFTIAECMENEGKVYAFDLHDHRVDLIKDGAKRLGVSIIEAKKHDSSVFDASLETADIVLCDVPCSGLGVISRKPEIKYKAIEEIDSLPSIQLRILSNGSKYLKKGGKLVYSTCTLNKNENESVVNEFLKNNSDYSLTSDFAGSGYKTYLPHVDGCDGFFVALMVKTDE